ncbi:hypothetical protein BDL97_05G026300 [Sphagnum fallax]|nr:hypothetical protein BDL97_05G026300 [Sphagnum fallax]
MGTIARTRSSRKISVVSVSEESPEVTRAEKKRQGKTAPVREPLVDVTNTTVLRTTPTRGRPPRPEAGAVAANQRTSRKGSGDDDGAVKKDAGAALLKKGRDFQVLSKKPGSLEGENGSVTRSSRTRARSRSDLCIATPKLKAPNYANNKTERMNHNIVTATTGRRLVQESAGKRRASPGQKDCCTPQKKTPPRKRRDDGTQSKDERGKLGHASIVRSVSRELAVKQAALKKKPTAEAKDSQQQAKLKTACKKQEGKQEAESIPERIRVPKDEEIGCRENLVSPSPKQKQQQQLKDSQQPPWTSCVRRNGSRGAKKVINYAEDNDESTAKLISRSKPSSTPCATAVKKRDQQETRKKMHKPVAGVLKASNGCGSAEGDNSSSKNQKLESSIAYESMIHSVNLLTMQQLSVKKIEKVHTRSCESSNAYEDCCLTSGNPGGENLTTTHQHGELLRDCSSDKLLRTQKASKKPSNDKKTAAKKVPTSLRKQDIVVVSELVLGCNAAEAANPISDHDITSAELNAGVQQIVQNETTSTQRGQKRGRKEIGNVSLCPSSIEKTQICKEVLERGSVDPVGSYQGTPVTNPSELLSGAYRSPEEKASSDTDIVSVKVDVLGYDGDEPPLEPLKSFQDAEIPAKVLDCCGKLGKPTPLQANVLPVLLRGDDVIGIAAQGQALAYGVPALVHVLKKRKSYVRKRPSPLCLVLSSSADHAQQIVNSLEEWFGSLRVKIASANGDPLDTSKRNIPKSGVAIVVATPGGLQQMLENGSCSLALVSFLVLDGADCMLDDKAAMQELLEQIPRSRQTAVFASNWQPELEQLMKDFMPNSKHIKVLEEAARDARLTSLLHTFQKSKKNGVVVFALYKEEALHVESLLRQRGWKVAAVHGGIMKTERKNVVNSFKDGKCSILVATDVAVRGLVIPNVDYVINYSYPYTAEDYAVRLNQSGRTGRKGIVHTFFTPAYQARAQELVEVLTDAGQVVPDELLKMINPSNKKARIGN